MAAKILICGDEVIYGDDGRWSCQAEDMAELLNLATLIEGSEGAEPTVARAIELTKSIFGQRNVKVLSLDEAALTFSPN